MFKMKLLVLSVAVGCLLVGLASGNPITDSISWGEFKEKYDKSYESAEEDSERQGIFARNLQKIKEFNQDQSAKLGFELGVNHFSDLSDEEYLNFAGKPSIAKRSTFDVSNHIIPEKWLKQDVPVPDAIDYRSTVPARVGPIKDQGSCASSWAFTVCGLLEAQEFGNSTAHYPTSLSVQNLIDCIDPHACRGGLTTELGLELVEKEGGVMREMDYPYESSKGLDDFPCRYKKNDYFVTSRIKGYQVLPRGEEGTMKWAVALSGPIGVTIDATLDTFRHYKSGVYFDPRCKTTPYDGTHSIVVVGYGHDTDFGDYWIVKNSWSEAWGMEGYMYLARNRPNHCGVANFAILTEPMTNKRW